MLGHASVCLASGFAAVNNMKKLVALPRLVRISRPSQKTKLWEALQSALAGTTSSLEISLSSPRSTTLLVSGVIGDRPTRMPYDKVISLVTHNRSLLLATGANYPWLSSTRFLALHRRNRRRYKARLAQAGDDFHPVGITGRRRPRTNSRRVTEVRRLRAPNNAPVYDRFVKRMARRGRIPSC